MDKQTLIITRKEIETVLDVRSALPVVEEAFRLYGLGKVVMPAKTYVTVPRHNGDFRAMPAYLNDDWEAAGLKWVNVHPGNLGGTFPSVMAVLIYSDPATGFPLAIMDGTYITRIRTGAAGGVAAKHLARPDSSVVALVGCGAQADTQLAAVQAVRDVSRIRVFDVRPESAERFRARLVETGSTVEVAGTVEACVSGADIVITTTPSRKPLVMADWLRAGCHVNAIGADAPGKQELDPQILLRARVVIDDWDQASHSGEINVPVAEGLFSRDRIHGTLGEVVAGLKPGRESADTLTVFDSTGLAIQDIAVARYVYDHCRDRGVGTALELV